MAKPEIWILYIPVLGYLSNIIMYIMVQFDSKYKKRNQIDFHYTHFLITLPTFIGISQGFHPKSTPLRMFYCFMLVTNIFVWQMFLFLGIKFTKFLVQKHQTSTTAEIIEWEYRLMGSKEVLGLISLDERVNYLKKLHSIDSLMVNLYSPVQILKPMIHINFAI